MSPSFNRKPEACALRVSERSDRPKRRRTNLRSVPGFGSNDLEAVVHAGSISAAILSSCPPRERLFEGDHGFSPTDFGGIGLHFQTRQSKAGIDGPAESTIIR